EVLGASWKRAQRQTLNMISGLLAVRFFFSVTLIASSSSKSSSTKGDVLYGGGVSSNVTLSDSSTFLVCLFMMMPDIMFSVCLCARFQEAPKTSHLEAVACIFRYIKDTTHLGLWYPEGTGIETVVYADADHAGDYVDRKSTSGICTFVGCCLTSWFSKKQISLSISTTEAEYVSAEKACQQALWMKQALIDYDIRLDDVPITCDNKGAIDLSENPVQHSRTKRIEIHHHFLRYNVQKGHILIEKVMSGAYVFTDRWSLDELAYGVPSDGPYQTKPPFPDDIILTNRIDREDGPYQTKPPFPDDIILTNRIDREGQVCRICHKEEINVQEYQVLTHEIEPTLKPLEEIIRENIFFQRGNRDHVPACLCYILYCVVHSEKFNLSYYMTKRMEWVTKQSRLILPYGMLLTHLFKFIINENLELYKESYVLYDRVMTPLAAKLEQKHKKDRGTRRGRHSTSSSTFNQPSSSYLNDDDNDGIN
nr:copia protein [Tanacetum cinerariifolium]